MSQEKNRKITDFVPKILREQLDHPETITQLLPNYLSHVALEDAIYFIQDALEHQSLIPNCAVFPAHMVRVEVEDRKSNGKVLGSKAILHFKGKNTDGEITDQHIQTGWIEYHGWGVEKLSWEIALANTLKEIAEDNIGEDVFIQKHVFESGDSYKKARMAINVTPKFKYDDDNESDKAPEESRPRKTSVKKAPKIDWRDRTLGLLDTMDPDEYINEKDIDEIVQIFEQGELTDDEILSDVAKWFQMSPSKLIQPSKPDNDQLVWCIQLFLENV